MSKKRKNGRSYSKYDPIMDQPVLIVVVAVLAIAMGVFFIVSTGANKPITRDEALSYSGAFESYEISKNYRGIHFYDGSCYNVYPHTESSEFQEVMKSLDPGTTLYICVNPHNDFVVEIKTDNEELLNFESSQQAIDSYDNGYIAIGVFACAAGLFLIVYAIGSTRYKRNEEKRHASRKDDHGGLKTNSAVMRYADETVKGRTLLEAKVQGYDICYRRVRFVNELIVNGRVYDEKKGLIEFEHRLLACVDGHEIEAGLDAESCSYIKFDRTVVRHKKRLV